MCNRNGSLSITALSVSLCFLGCGNSQSNSYKTEFSVVHIAQARRLIQPSRPATVKPGESLCTDTLVRFLPELRQMQIVLHCVGVENGGRVNLIVQRYHSWRPRHSVDMFSGFAGSLSISPSEAVLQAGRCVVRKELACWASINGRVRIMEQVSVGAHDPCKDIIVIVGLRSVGLNLLGHRLFSGKPRGC